MSCVRRLTYAGIGSRKTPFAFASRMRNIAAVLECRGWLLHSGGAPRADTWFEEGVRDTANARIFLPWAGFNNHYEQHDELFNDRVYVCERAHEIARQFHPAYHRLDAAGRLLMGRNSYQVLGPTLDKPVTCVVCWTPDGRASGGTGQALRIAAAYDVPVFNLHDPTAIVRLETFVLAVEATQHLQMRPDEFVQLRKLLGEGLPVNGWTLAAARELADEKLNKHLSSTDPIRQVRIAGKFTIERVPFPKDADFERASGDVVCKVCGLMYSKHPNSTNVPTMHRVCDGAWTRNGRPDVIWVKL